jgi:hypothetical protein
MPQLGVRDFTKFGFAQKVLNQLLRHYGPMSAPALRPDVRSGITAELRVESTHRCFVLVL